MSVLLTPSPTPETPPIPNKTMAELLHELGGIPADRVRLYPQPGTATEADAYWVNERGGHCELVDGTLVEKPVSVPESFLATLISYFLTGFVVPRNLGLVTSPDAMYRMIQGNVREPDVSFTRRDRLPNPLPQVGGWCPDLCVEVLSPSNTKAEMEKKRAEYFAAGCRLVWEIDPRTRSADVYTGPGPATRVDESGVLDGKAVLPGFTLPLRDLFGPLDALAAPPP